MTTWRDLAAAEPRFAAEVRAAFGTRKHATMATLRRDGAPRISGTEVQFDPGTGQLGIGSMPGARKALDLRRDPRVALHCPTVDTPDDDPGSWAEAKISGRAVETSDARRSDSPHSFVIDIDEVVLTTVGGGGDHLLIRAWHPGRQIARHERR